MTGCQPANALLHHQQDKLHGWSLSALGYLAVAYAATTHQKSKGVAMQELTWNITVWALFVVCTAASLAATLVSMTLALEPKKRGAGVAVCVVVFACCLFGFLAFVQYHNREPQRSSQADAPADEFDRWVDSLTK